MPKFTAYNIIHSTTPLALSLLWPLRLVPKELLRLQIADLPLEYLEVGHLVMMLHLSFLLLTAILPLCSQHYLAAPNHPRLRVLCLCLDPPVAFLCIPLAEMKSNLSGLLPLQPHVFFVRNVQHIIIFFIISRDILLAASASLVQVAQRDGLV